MLTVRGLRKSKIFLCRSTVYGLTQNNITSSQRTAIDQAYEKHQQTCLSYFSKSNSSALVPVAQNHVYNYKPKLLSPNIYRLSKSFSRTLRRKPPESASGFSSGEDGDGRGSRDGDGGPPPPSSSGSP